MTKHLRGIMTTAVIALVACSAGKKTDELPAAPPGGATGFKTINYLKSIAYRKTITGIHNREPNTSPSRWTEQVYTSTGKYPGLWSGDFLFQPDNIANRGSMIQEALNQWKKGSLVHIMWHACNPALAEPCGWDSLGVKSRLTDAQWNELTTDGAPLNRRWKEMIDEVAVHLDFLQQNGVEVLWRPLHEMNQGVFWWGGRSGPGGTRKLWQITHDYMTNTKHLKNLVWVWDIQDFNSLSSDAVAYNPGSDYWDIAALDVYNDNTGYSQEKYDIMVAAAAGKPMAIGECQKYLSAQQLAQQPGWAFFMGWSELVFSNNSPAELNSIMHAGNTVTLDQMPGWK